MSRHPKVILREITSYVLMIAGLVILSKDTLGGAASIIVGAGLFLYNTWSLAFLPVDQEKEEKES